MISKKLTPIICLLAALGANSIYAAPIQPVDRIVAVVGKAAITQLELDKRVAETIAGMKAKKITLLPAAKLEKQVLERMITDEAQIQTAEQNGIKISDEELDAAIKQIAQQNKVGVDALYAKAANEDLSHDEFRSQIRREMMIDNLRKREVDAKINVTDTEVAQALKSAKNKDMTEYNLAAILIALPESPDEQVLAKREKIVKKVMNELNSGKSFDLVSTEYSDAPDATHGGKIGWRQAEALPAALVSTLNGMKKGENSEPIRTQQGFYIFKLIDKRVKGVAQIVAQYHVEQILIKTNENVSDAEAKTRIDQIKLDISRGKNFEEAARQNSEDGSSTKGGDLGWINLGDTVPEFEKVMIALPLNAVSDPVRSPFGWHLLKVLAKRQQDISADREANAIRQQIRQRKAQTEYVDWLRQLRDSMFIQNRLKDTD